MRSGEEDDVFDFVTLGVIFLVLSLAGLKGGREDGTAERCSAIDNGGGLECGDCLLTGLDCSRKRHC